jgi:hypothetical protein
MMPAVIPSSASAATLWRTSSIFGTAMITRRPLAAAIAAACFDFPAPVGITRITSRWRAQASRKAFSAATW